MRSAVLGAAALGWCNIAMAVDYTWLPAGGGSFSDTANWDPTGAPTTVSDQGFFASSGSGTILINGPTSTGALHFANTAGAYTLDLNGTTLSVGNSGTTAFGGISLGSGTAAGQVNQLTIQGGTLLSVGNSNFLRVGNSATSSNNTLTITGANTVVRSPSTSGNSAQLGVAGSNNNTLTVENGATVILFSNIPIGVLGATPSTGNVLNVNGATFSSTGGNRGITVNNGVINLTNGYSDMGFVRLNPAGNNSTLNFNSGILYARNLQIDNGRDLVIGDGGGIPAIFGPAYSNATVTIGAATASKDIVLSSNARIVGTGSIILNTAGGTLRGSAGSVIAPSIIGQPTLTTDDRPVGTLQLAGSFDHRNITMNFDVPGAIGIGTISADKLLTNSGTYTHGGTINFDLATYFPPPDTNYEVQVLSFSNSTGSTGDTVINFVNGAPLPYEWRADGLYLLLAQQAANSTWNFNGNGDWTGNNWLRFVPNGIDTTANFGTIITSGVTVNVDTGITVGHVNFTSPVSYTISGANTLTFDVSTGSATISATLGSHSILSPVSLSDPTDVNIAAGASVAATGGVNGAAALSKRGDGTLVLGKTVVDSLSVEGGTARIQPDGTNAGALETKAVSASGTGRLDITNNAVIVDYDAVDPTAAIRSLLALGYDGGSWNGFGINSSTAAATPGHSVGYARSTEVTPGAIFGTPDATATLIRYTRGGDANLDGTTNISDFSALAANFNVPGEWVTGDFNYDGTVNIGDFSILAANFNQTIAAAGARGAVPEPAGALVLAVLPLMRRRR